MHRVLVDFENVPTADLGEIGGQPVEVTLLPGKLQERLEAALGQPVHRHAAQVTLVEMDASGRNAPDLAPACHLGRAAVANPADCFHIHARNRVTCPGLASAS